MLSLLILIPLACLVLLNLPFLPMLRKAAWFIALPVPVFQMAFALLEPHALMRNTSDPLNLLLRFNLSADHLSLLVIFTIGLVVLCCLLAARTLINNEKQSYNFINLILLSLAGMNGLALLNDLFSLYVFIEITAISSFILIVQNREADALEGAFKYIIFSAVATIMMLASTALLLLSAGGTSFSVINTTITASPGFFPRLAMGLFICGLLIKGGVIPFHWWVPDVYSSAPAPASILLAGIVTKVCGIYALMRVVIAVFGFSESVKAVLLLTGCVSIVAGALAALGQNDFKRMLAYSSISQIGYIVIGFGTGVEIGVAGAAFHFFNHAVFKSTLFVNSAAVESSLGTTNMDRMGGIASKMHYTGATSVIAFLSAAGIPPLAGFWSKLLIILALWQAGYYTYAVIAVTAAVLTMAYFLRMQRRIFFGTLREGLEHVKEAGSGLVIAAVILAAITVAAGLLFPAVLDRFILPAGDIILKHHI